MHDPQILHKKLVQTLNDIYGENRFSLRKKQLSIYDTKSNQNISHEIKAAVSLIVSTLNYSGGSIGEVDLYQLLHDYLTDENKRREINEILKGN